MKVAHMLKRIFIPILILSVFVLGLIPTSSVEAAALSYNDVTRFDDTPQPFALPTAISSDLPCNPEAVHGLFFYRTECPHCQETLDQVIYPLESELGADLDIRLVNIDYAGNYELFIQFQEYFHTAAGDRAIPTLIIGEHIIIGEDAIRAEIDPLVQDGIAAGGIAWTALEGFDPSTIITSTSTDAAGEICSLDSDSCEVGTPIYAAYFYQTGCQECSMVEADLAYLRSQYPQLIVESFNIFDSAALGEWMAARVERDDFHTPAVFIGNQAWIGEQEITPAALSTALDCFKAEGSPRFWDAYDESQGNQNIVERFRSMSWLTVVLAGLVDGLNPCAFATLIFFVSYLSLSGRKGKEILLVGFTFTLGVFLAYLLVGLGLYRILDLLGNWLNILGKVIYAITAVLCLVFSILSFSDYLKTRKGSLEDMSLKLPEKLRARINQTIRKGRNIQAYAWGAFGTGLVVSLLELACTGQVYLPTIIFVSSVPELHVRALSYLLLYNLMFILPLIVIFVLVYFGTSSKQLTTFIQKRGSGIKLALAILFLVLAIWLGWSVLMK